MHKYTKYLNCQIGYRKLTLFRQMSSNADSNCQKMGQSQRGVKEGGFEGGGVGSIIKFHQVDFKEYSLIKIEPLSQYFEA